MLRSQEGLVPAASLPASKLEISVTSLPAWPLRNLRVLGYKTEVAVTISTWEDFAKCPDSETPHRVGNVLGSWGYTRSSLYWTGLDSLLVKRKDEASHGGLKPRASAGGTSAS